MGLSYSSDPRYAADKLHNSVVSYNGWPIRVRYIDNMEVCFNFLGDGIERFCDLEDLDLTPIKLGYVNLARKISYLSRIPARYYRQGLREHILNSKGVPYRQLDKYLNNTVRGVYPNFERCIEYTFNKDRIGAAFCRKFGLIQAHPNAEHKNAIKLQYRGLNVGEVDVKKDEIILDDSYLYLNETLQEIINEKP